MIFAKLASAQGWHK